MIKRYINNPLITPEMVRPSMEGYNVLGAFNPGVSLYNGHVILIMRIPENCVEQKGFVSVPYYEFKNGEGFPRIRKIARNDPDLKLKDTRAVIYKNVEYPSTVSHLRIARSEDGISFRIEDKPFIYPCIGYESLGVEDARISKIEDTYYINYTAVSGDGFCTMLAETRDFKEVIRKGIIFPPLNKDVAIFEEKIKEKYIALHRPHNQWFGRPSVWYAESFDLINWGNHKCLIRPGDDDYENVKIGGGCAPIKTKEGWLEIYHSVGDSGKPGTEIYYLNLLLLDLDEPWKVIKRSSSPVMAPEKNYEKRGFVNNVIFTNGMIVKPDGSVDIYYGACDETICLAQTSVNELLNML